MRRLPRRDPDRREPPYIVTNSPLLKSGEGPGYGQQAPGFYWKALLYSGEALGADVSPLEKNIWMFELVWAPCRVAGRPRNQYQREGFDHMLAALPGNINAYHKGRFSDRDSMGRRYDNLQNFAPGAKRKAGFVFNAAQHPSLETQRFY